MATPKDTETFEKVWRISRGEKGDTGPMGPPGPPGPLEMPMAALQAEIGRRLDRQMMAEAEKMMTIPSNLLTPPEGAPYFDTAKMARALQELHEYKYKGVVAGPIGTTGTMAQQPAPHQTLEIRDVERLAKAGVTMSFEQIKDRITPDIETKQSPFAAGDMIRPLYDRWLKATPERDTNMFVMSWAGAAFRIGDKVQVMLCTQGARAVLLEDDYALYPSDALLASLIMMLKTETPRS